MSRWGWLFFSVPPLVAGLLCLTALWPALLSPDSLETWAHASSGALEDTHSIFYEFVVWCLTRLSPTPAIVAVAQLLALSLTAGYTLWRVFLWGAPLWSVLLALVPATASPASALIGSYLWPDALYSSGLVLLSVFAFEAGLDRGRSFAVGRWWTLLPPLIAWVALMRPNGPMAAFGVAAILVLVGKHARRRMVWVLIMSTAMWLLGKSAIVALSGAGPKSGPSGWLNPFVLQIAAHRASGTPTSETDERLLLQVYPERSWPYEPTSARLNIYAPGFNWDAIARTPLEFLRIWWHQLLADPLVNLRHQIRLSRFIWSPGPTVPGFYIHDLVLGTEEILTMSANTRLDPTRVPTRPLFDAAVPLVGAYFEHTLRPHLRWFFWRPGLHLWLLLGVAAVVLRRSGRWSVLSGIAPSLLSSLGIALFTGTQELRYQFGVMLCSLLLWPLALVSRRTWSRAAAREPTSASVESR